MDVNRTLLAIFVSAGLVVVLAVAVVDRVPVIRRLRERTGGEPSSIMIVAELVILTMTIWAVQRGDKMFALLGVAALLQAAAQLAPKRPRMVLLVGAIGAAVLATVGRIAFAW